MLLWLHLGACLRSPALYKPAAPSPTAPIGAADAEEGTAREGGGVPEGVLLWGAAPRARGLCLCWLCWLYLSPEMLVLVGLVLCLTPVNPLTAFPPKFQVGKLNGDVVVQCDTLEPHISWTLNGEEEPMAELVAEGRNLTILGLDLPATGNYSCWAGPVLLDTIYVVVSDAREEEIDISCQAESYYGSFHCFWPGSPSAVFRARLTHSDGSMGPWVLAAGDHGQFNVSLADPSFCPFGEELHPLQLHLEGLSDTSYLSLSRHFFLRDIVRPDPPQDLTLRWQGEQLHLVWAPPTSWQVPKSYFSLLYHLQYELPNGTQVEQFVEGMEKTQVQVDAQRVRISCRDPYTPPAWSPWSPWQDLKAPQ